MSKGTCPQVLSWGSAPLARINKGRKTVVYPDGLTMSFDLGASSPFVETLRVTSESTVEHRFTMGEIEGEWFSARAEAFRDCVSKANYLLPHERTVIYGPSHADIQQGVIERFLHNRVSSSKKRVSWGDEHETVVDNPGDAEENKYGGWGLEHIRVIPNRHEMAVLYGFWQTDLEVEDELRYFVDRIEPSDCGLLEEDDGPLTSSSLASMPLLASSSSSSFGEDGGAPVYIPGEEQLSDDSEGDDEEEALLNNEPNSKRVKVFEDETTVVPEISTKVEEEPSRPSCTDVDASAGVELREVDFWLLQNESVENVF